jgi:hypothetical protein
MSSDVCKDCKLSDCKCDDTCPTCKQSVKSQAGGKAKKAPKKSSKKPVKKSSKKPVKKSTKSKKSSKK